LVNHVCSDTIFAQRLGVNSVSLVVVAHRFTFSIELTGVRWIDLCEGVVQVRMKSIHDPTAFGLLLILATEPLVAIEAAPLFSGAAELVSHGAVRVAKGHCSFPRAETRVPGDGTSGGDERQDKNEDKDKGIVGVHIVQE
jgi:hypothetical protein